MKVGFYESDITPPLGCFIPGHGKDMRAADVHDRLYSKAAVIENDGTYAVIVAIDICEYPTEMHDIVTKRICEYTGIKQENICITSTHSHYGGPVMDNPIIGCYADPAYKDVFFRLVADSAILAYKRLKEATISFGSAEVKGVAHCRDSLIKDGSLKTWAVGEYVKSSLAEPDDELTVLFAESDGVKTGAIYSFSCHQDTVLEKTKGYSGDYSSEASKKLKEKYGKDFVSIYLPAPCGDINDIDYFKDDAYKKRLGHRKIGSILANAIIDAESNTHRISGKIYNVKEEIKIKRRQYTDEAARKILSKYLNNNEDFFRINLLVYYKAACHDDYSDLYVQVISIGDLAIYIYPGEMFVEYSHRTKQNSPFKYNMVVENSNAYGGYIPTVEAFAENSDLYEISPAYNSSLVPEAGETLYDKAMEIAVKIISNFNN